ncbi:phytanoyl-CoA dioxygenase family protein [Thalassospira sp.]|uniref:phytanoyl-CoA dioxygenase family protein n=1 Tax=Thalassospira sp. TaxID=1912094 RepID=UPI0027360BB4|nr:phytanoyl-CoA dioxygenase family protein [Thalassospira sp.]MDP2697483.1 hypothetical protein [Thalassospira sp.]
MRLAGRGRIVAPVLGIGNDGWKMVMISARQACDAGFWAGFNPGLTIDGTDNGFPAIDAARFGLSAVSDHFWQEGYFRIEDVLPSAPLLALRTGIERLVAEGLPPVMIYLYDEAWQVFAALRPLLTHFLGDKIALLPHFWALHVDPQSAGRGWPPHRDYQGDSVIGDDMAISLSLWVPLSIASPDNGCMYVLPRSFEAAYGAPVTDPAQVALQDVRALPAVPGTVMGWRQDVYHWGGRASRFASEPRISLSLEFQNAAFDPMGDPLLNPDHPPCFAERLALIAGQFGKYRHMQDISPEMGDWAQDILSFLNAKHA